MKKIKFSKSYRENARIAGIEQVYLPKKIKILFTASRVNSLKKDR